jgi:class 3 adenylate cyclase
MASDVLDIDATLQQARDRAEVQIATFRLVLTGLLALMGVATYLDPKTRSGSMLAILFGSLLFASVLFVLARRLGGRTPLSVTALVFDLGFVPLMFAIGTMGMALPSDPAARFFLAAWSMYLVPAMLLTHMTLSLLRNNKATALIGGLVSAAIFMFCTTVAGGKHPAQYMAAGLIALHGLIGFFTARAARRTLETFARLHQLQRFMPGAAVERVLHAHADEAASLGGRLVTVTVMATDLRGFTAFSEKLTPDEVVRQLNGYHGTMVAEVARHGGEVDKFIGDGMLATFGLERREKTVPTDGGASAAVACARSMLGALESLNAEREKAGLFQLAMGIGIHTGEVVAGNIGAPGRMEFTVIGDAVNTAARLESATKDLQVPAVASTATVQRLREPHTLRALGAVELKGKAEPLSVYALV